MVAQNLKCPKGLSMKPFVENLIQKAAKMCEEKPECKPYLFHEGKCLIDLSVYKPTSQLMRLPFSKKTEASGKGCAPPLRYLPIPEDLIQSKYKDEKGNLDVLVFITGCISNPHRTCAVQWLPEIQTVIVPKTKKPCVETKSNQFISITNTMICKIF